MEARSLLEFYHIDGDLFLFLQKSISIQETISNLPSFIAIRDLIASQFAVIILFSYFLIGMYLILHKFCSVLTCDILGIGLL